MSLERYWTTEFTEIYVAALESHAGFQKATRNFDETIQLRCYDTPDGTDQRIDYEIRRGTIRHHTVEEPAPSRAIRDLPFDKKRFLARTSAPYSIWTRLDRGEIGVIDCILSPEYKFEGQKLKVLRHIKVFTLMGDIAASLEKRY